MRDGGTNERHGGWPDRFSTLGISQHRSWTPGSLPRSTTVYDGAVGRHQSSEVRGVRLARVDFARENAREGVLGEGERRGGVWRGGKVTILD